MYDINECGVCLNPEVIAICDGAEIEWMEQEGNFYYGYRLDFITGGASSPCMVNKSFATKDEMLRDAVKNMKEYVESDVGWYTKAVRPRYGDGDDEIICGGYRSSLKKSIAILESLLSYEKSIGQRQYVQLKLF